MKQQTYFQNPSRKPTETEMAIFAAQSAAIRQHAAAVERAYQHNITALDEWIDSDEFTNGRSWL